jgi:iron complex outermembrane receptor protein
MEQRGGREMRNMSGWMVGLLVVALGPERAHAQAPAQAPPEAVEEIVVTATKRAVDPMELPAAIALVTSAEIEDSDLRDLFSLQTVVPGMVFNRAPDDGLALTFRGVGAAARPQAFDQSIALFQDGVFLAKGRLYSLPIFDVERIELIKGPHTTDVGKNASVGAIHVVSRRPGEGLGGEARVSGDVVNGGYTLDGAVDVPLHERAQLRVALNRMDTRGWVKNVATGERVPQDDNLGIRGTLAAEPLDELSVEFRYQYGDWRRRGSPFQLVDGVGGVPPAYGEIVLDDRSNVFTAYSKGGDSVHAVKSHIASLRASYALGEHALVSETGYAGYASDYVDEFDTSVFSYVDFLREEQFDQFSQELRLVSPSGERFEYMLGVFFLDSEWRSIEDQVWATPGFPATAPGTLFNGPFVNDFTQDTRSWALFASGTWRITERLRASGGVRYTNEDKNVLFGRFNRAPITPWNTVNNPPFPVMPLHFAGDFVDGSFSLQLDASDTTMLYAGYGTGGKLGGFVEVNSVVSANPAQDARIASEFTRSVEAGVKNTLFDGRVELDATGFWMRIEDYQDTASTGAGFITLNLPLETRGAEVQSRFTLPGELSGSLGFTYTHARAKFNGQTFQNRQAPRWTMNAVLEWTRAISARFRVRLRSDVRFRDSLFILRGQQFRVQDFTTVGAVAALESLDGAYGMSVIGRNLADEVHADYYTTTPDPYTPAQAAPGALRSVLISAWVKF